MRTMSAAVTSAPRKKPLAASAAVLGAVIVLAGSPSAARADFDPARWEYLRDLSSEAHAQGFVRFDVDDAAHAHASMDLADLRVVGPGDREVPYSLTHETGGAATVEVPATLLNSGQEKDEAVFDLDLGVRTDVPDAEKIHGQITLDLEGADFVRRVEVSVSDDRAAAYRVLNPAGIVFNYRVGGRTLSESTVTYPNSIDRYIRVRLGAGEGPLPRVRGAHVKRVTEKRVELATRGGRLVSTERVGRATEYVFDLGIPRAPTDRVSFAASEATPYKREAWVGFGDAVDDLTAAAYRGELVNIRSGELSVTRNDVETPGGRGRYVKLRVIDGDDQSLAITAVTASHYPFTVVTRSEGGGPLRLAYGNPKAHRPEYDFGRQLDATRPAIKNVARLGTEALNPRFVPEKAPLTERWTWLPGFAVGLGALALAAVLWRTMRAGQRTPQ